MEELGAVGHLFACVFLFHLSASMAIPAITDVTIEVLCPGRDRCSLAIYLSGANQLVTGLGMMLATPLVGNLSDKYGRKALLTLPMTAAILPLAVLGCGRSRVHVYFYFMIKTISGMFSDGSMHFLSLNYVADKVCQRKAFRSLVHSPASPLLVLSLAQLLHVFCAPPASSSSTLTRAATIAFFNSLADHGYISALLYYLKAQFHLNKDQFADLLPIIGFVGAISQLIFMPLVAPSIGEERLLTVGLLASCTHIFLYSIAWSYWGMAQGCVTCIISSGSIISPLVFTPLTALLLSEHAPFAFRGFSIMCAGFTSLLAYTLSVSLRSNPTVS